MSAADQQQEAEIQHNPTRLGHSERCEHQMKTEFHALCMTKSCLPSKELQSFSKFPNDNQM